jgi:hypothetical protein
MHTVTGQYLESFLKWKTIPNEAAGGDYKKASKFDVTNFIYIIFRQLYLI